MQPSLAKGRLQSTSVSSVANSSQGLMGIIESNLRLECSPRVDGVTSSYLHSRKKRTLDISVATTLILLIVPFLALILLAVKFSSPGPSLFRQSRYGNYRKPFFIFKFRSMYHENSIAEQVEQAKQNDARVTPVGKVIRRTSIDELPQLINVLRGEMSLVGPRPHALSHDDYYSTHLTDYEYRFLAKPGITGLAQVNGSRGATPNISDMKRRVDLDVEYVQNASFTLDCKILFRTVREVFASSTAY